MERSIYLAKSFCNKNLILLIIFVLSTVFSSSYVFAQDNIGNYDYNNSASLIGFIVSIITLLFGCCVAVFLIIFYGVQYKKMYNKKGIKDKDLLAFIPFVNNYYLSIAVGDKGNAFLYGFGQLFAFMFAFCTGLIPLIGLLTICISEIIIILLNVSLFRKVAVAFGKNESLGLIYGLVTPLPVVGIIIQLYILNSIANSTVVSNKE